MRKRDPAALPAGAELRADRRFVEALARELAVLRCCAPVDRGLGNRETAARTGLPAATVSRLTFTLTSLGCLICAPERTGSTVSLNARHLSSMVYIEVCRTGGVEAQDPLARRHHASGHVAAGVHAAAGGAGATATPTPHPLAWRAGTSIYNFSQAARTGGAARARGARAAHTARRVRGGLRASPPGQAELGPAAQTGVRDRPGALPELRRRAEDHRGDPAG